MKINENKTRQIKRLQDKVREQEIEGREREMRTR